MPELRVKLTAEEAAELDARARERRLSRSAYVCRQLFALERPMDERELHALVAAKAREGNMRAIEILARSTPVHAAAAPAEPAEAKDVDPFQEVDELAGRRRARSAG